ncbi:hypothetical protein AVEN_29593-1 [Araneus ventricosus]|uniref:Uncharacterized protein n=1 Tax=Araneus ventricosus TaxID=182803 RepID=A0A4Y2T6P3_ARAVE|nr:hypothetical protein AVEN_29593-1 [Araneus ventricosus]
MNGDALVDRDIHYRDLTPCLRLRGHGQEWVRAADYSTTQRQHSRGNRPDILGTSDQSLQTRGLLCQRQAITRSHHSLEHHRPSLGHSHPTPLGH